MKIAVFSTKPYDKHFLTAANDKYQHELTFFEAHLNKITAPLAFGFEGICCFVHDELNREVLSALSQNGLRLAALRCAGFNNVDIQTATELGITVARVPAYSPHGVAEHSVALMLALNRKICRAYNRVREGNFSLDGLLGFEMYGKTAGIIGTGKIGILTARILSGFGIKILAYDTIENKDLESIGGKYVRLDELYAQSDIVSLHLPLTRETYHLINEQSISQMKKGVMLINTSRGGLIDTQSVIGGLKSGKIAYLGLDVYEEEGDLFFNDLSGNVIQDDVFARLLTFPNVLITGHQAFFTNAALKNIAETTLKNAADFKKGQLDQNNLVKAALVK